MDQFQNEKLQIQLVDTTSIFNKQINSNCFFDGYILIYLGGAHIIYHNVFQNTKVFLERYSINEVQAMSFQKTNTELSIAIASKNPLCIEFYTDGKKVSKVELYEQIQIIDMKFIEKKKCCLLAYDKIKNISSLYIVSLKKKINKIQLPEVAHKLIYNETKMFIIIEKGILQFDIETQSLHQQKKYQNIKIIDILLLDHGKGILFDSENNYYYFYQKQIIFQSNLGQNFTRKVKYKSSIKVGRNILISFKQEFGISQYQYEDNKVCFINHFQYNEQIKGNIVGMHSFGDELNLAIAFQSPYKDQNRIQHYLFNLSILSTQRKFINPFTRLVQGGVDHGEVIGLQLTIPSQVYYMSGPYVINYSYVQNIQKKHKYSIHENPRFVSVHPLGHQILCVFQTSIKFYQKIEDELIEIWTQAYVCNNARYTESGLLVLCINQEGIYEIILYDSNYFRRIHKFSNIYLKHSITKIQFDEDETELILYSGRDLLIHKFKTGQKLSQFRQKRQVSEASCIQYDSIRKCILVASKNNLIVCRKNQQYCLNFNSQKLIQIGHEITCIHLNQYSQSIFMGTSDGQILYADYPLQIEEQTIDDQKRLKIFYKSIKIHNNPVSNILITLGGKYLFSSIKGQGLCILKMKYLTARKAGNYNHFDISNYNSIQTSSKSYLEITQEQLKNLLQKRKTIFNELDQFKKQWQIKRVLQINAITTKNKKKQLSQINLTLNEINRAKLQHQDIKDQLFKFQKGIELSKMQNIKAHEKQLIHFYDQNDILKSKLDQVKSSCSKEIEELKEKCSDNLKQISQELQKKFRSFQEKYNIMKANLINYKKKVDFQAEQDVKTRQLEIQYIKQSLLKEQQQLYKCNHQVKGQIARNKKQLERFLNRKDFLQNKQRFFVQQIKLSKIQQVQLKELKLELGEELSNLQNITHKKQKRLRKYFMENDILAKYQFIHNKIQKQTLKELQFIQLQHTTLKQNIGQLQKQILFISNERNERQIQLKSKKQKLLHLKESLSRINQRRQFLQFQIRQLDYSISNIDNNKEINQQSKNQYYTQIYNKFFIQKQLEKIISNKQIKQNEVVLQENKANQRGIHNILVDHKEYLINNMGMLQQFNTRSNEEINHSNLKYQSQNFNLISECKDKKEQITNKKRILHDLVHQMQKTNKRISQIHSSSRIKQKKIEQVVKKDIPFVIYEKQQEQKNLMRKEKSESSLWKLKQSTYQVRKMLEIQKLKSPDEKQPIRRIQTANLKKKTKQSNHECLFQDSAQMLNEFVYQGKPRTAGTAVRRYHKKENLQAKRIFSRNKSSSKPTTCNTNTIIYNGSKSKYSVFY